MKHLNWTIATILILNALNSQGQTTIKAITGNPVYLNFENRDTNNYIFVDTPLINNIWKIGEPVKSNFDSAYSIPIAIVTDTLNVYPINTTSSFIFKIESNDYTYIRFMHKYDTDSLLDGSIIQISYDNGANWINILKDTISSISLINFYSISDTIQSIMSEPGFTGNSGGWINSQIHFTHPINLTFRFTFVSDGIQTNKDGWMIDNFFFGAIRTTIVERKLFSQVNIYPNPANNKLHIKFDHPTLFTYSLYDLTGMELIVSNKAFLNKAQVNTESLTPGIYFLKILSENEYLTKKIVVIK